jgi:hypothetical protein
MLWEINETWSLHRDKRMTWHIFSKLPPVRSVQEQGCQMASFLSKTYQFGYILEDLGMENVVTFYVHLEYFTAIW